MSRPERRVARHRATGDGRPRLAPSSLLLYAAPVVAVLAGVALYLQREWAIAGLWGFSLDDSWIHAVFARNLATGNGFSFNPGEPVSGSTGPLYSAILSLLYLVTGEMVWTGKVFGILCQIAATLLLLRAGLHLERPAAWPGAPASTAAVPWKALTAAVLMGMSPSLLWASLSGMEISLYLLFVCAGLERTLAGKDVAATLWWSLGVWVRPDGLFLVALRMLGPRATLLKRVAMAGAFIVPLVAFNLWLGGTPLPQTVGAKAAWGLDLGHRTWNLIREWGALWGLPFRVDDELEHPLLLLPLLLLGAALLWKRFPLLALYVVGLPLAFSLFRENSASHKRYIVYVVPFGLLLAVTALGWLSARLPRAFGKRAFAAVALVAILWQGAMVVRKADTHGWNVQNINMMQRLLGTTAGNTTPPGATIAASDIGAIGYFSHRRVVDLMGLVSVSRSLPENLTRYQPALLIINVDWFGRYARPDSASGFFAFYDTDSTTKYTAMAAVELSHNTICSADQMVAFARQKPGDPPPPLYFHRF